MRAVETDAMQSRLLLPILLPLASAAALFFYVINLSRVLLAGGEWGSLVVASVLVVVILGIVAWISMHPDLRSSTLTVLTACLMFLVGIAGLTCLGPSQPEASAAASAPTPADGDPVATLDIEALASTKFQSGDFPTVAGVNEIRYSGAPGHTLAFTEKELNGFLLRTDDEPATGKVLLEPGTYTIYCTIPGHRAQGMDHHHCVLARGTSAGAPPRGQCRRVCHRPCPSGDTDASPRAASCGPFCWSWCSSPSVSGP